MYPVCILLIAAMLPAVWVFAQGGMQTQSAAAVEHRNAMPKAQLPVGLPGQELPTRSECEPLPDGSACQQTTCPEPGDVCRPRCVNHNWRTGHTIVIDCDCRDPDECHVEIPGGDLLPDCAGSCPEGYRCVRTITQQPDGTFDLCCDCEPDFCWCPGDLDESGVVDYGDLDEFVAELLSDEPDVCADVNVDGAVNGLDIQRFADFVLASGGTGFPCVTLPLGACCFPGGACQLLTPRDCEDLQGMYWGDDTSCEPVSPCPQPMGACCLSPSGCIVVTYQECVYFAGMYQGDGTDCDPDPCPVEPGACCTFYGDCYVTTPDACDGDWIGPGVPCDPDPCPPRTGACCLMPGGCVVLTYDDCMFSAGMYQGDGTDCDPDPCPVEPGACCSIYGGCYETTPDACDGAWMGPGVPCDPDPCPPPPLHCAEPGVDCWKTEPYCDGGTQANFALTPIPAGFFDPGSASFASVVILTGGAGVDTKMERLERMCFYEPLPYTASTPIRLIELQLSSCQAIYVPGSGYWNVSVYLPSSGPQQDGTLTATMEEFGGGTFDASFYVEPVYRFSREGNPSDVRIFDTRAEGYPPTFMSVQDIPWTTYDIDDGCSTMGDGFHAGTCEFHESCHSSGGSDPHSHCVVRLDCFVGA